MIAGQPKGGFLCPPRRTGGLHCNSHTLAGPGHPRRSSPSDTPAPADKGNVGFQKEPVLVGQSAVSSALEEDAGNRALEEAEECISESLTI